MAYIQHEIILRLGDWRGKTDCGHALLAGTVGWILCNRSRQASGGLCLCEDLWSVLCGVLWCPESGIV